MNIRKTILYLTALTFLFCAPVSGEKKIPLSQRHFPNAPRISAEKARKLLLAGVKMVIIDIPWSKEGFDKGHICGAIKVSTNEKKLNHLIKKIPKNYLVISY